MNFIFLNKQRALVLFTYLVFVWLGCPLSQCHAQGKVGFLLEFLSLKKSQNSTEYLKTLKPIEETQLPKVDPVPVNDVIDPVTLKKVEEDILRRGLQTGSEIEYLLKSPSGSSRLIVKVASKQLSEKWGPKEIPAEKWRTLDGMPKATVDIADDVVLEKAFYVTCYDTRESFPMWTAYMMTKTSVQKSLKKPVERVGWIRDEQLLRMGYECPSNRDFINMEGRSDANHPSYWQRGHMAPKMALQGFGTRAAEESFVLTNAVVQRKALNENLWQELEKYELEWANTFGDAYVLTGPFFEKPGIPKRFITGKGGHKIPVPLGFWKIVVVKDQGILRSASFLVPNNIKSRRGDVFRYQKSLAEIETTSGIKFFTTEKLPRDFKSKRDAIFQAKVAKITLPKTIPQMPSYRSRPLAGFSRGTYVLVPG